MGSADTLIEGTPFFIRYQGARKFTVLEAGAGLRGMARKRGQAGTRAEARELAGQLAPSTVREILEQTPAYGEQARKDREELIRVAEPGTRLWVLPFYYQDGGYRETGQAATATGLALNGVEALFGGPGDSTWLAGYRRDDGTEGKCSHRIVLTLAEARERWWILAVKNRRQVLVSGGHPDEERMYALRDEKHPGCLVLQGCQFMPES
jgi:hypothetical protein